MPRYFEDFEVGDSWDLGSVEFDSDEIVAFAREYDPLPFHLDPDRAQETRYGGLIASGWQVATRAMRRVAEHILAESACEGGRGVDDLRIYHPVRPGDTLSLEAQVVNTTPESRPTYGLAELKVTGTGKAGAEVFTMMLLPLIKRRNPGN